jgi:hypothetical protein
MIRIHQRLFVSNDTDTSKIICFIGNLFSMIQIHQRLFVSNDTDTSKYIEQNFDHYSSI